MVTEGDPGNILVAKIDLSESLDPVVDLVRIQHVVGSKGRLILEFGKPLVGGQTQPPPPPTAQREPDKICEPVRRLVTHQGLRAIVQQAGLIVEQMVSVGSNSSKSSDWQGEEGSWIVVASVSQCKRQDMELSPPSGMDTDAREDNEDSSAEAVRRAQRRADVMATYVRRSRAGLLEAHEQLSSRDDEYSACSNELLSRIDELQSGSVVPAKLPARASKVSGPTRRFRDRWANFLRIGISRTGFIRRD